MDDATVRDLIEKDFPFLQGCHYLDSASVCPAPRRAVEAMTSFYWEHPLNYGVGQFRQARMVEDKVDQAREEVAAFIGASPNEIAFTKNTTEAINIVSQGLDWKEGDRVVLSTLEHQSNVIPWLRAARKWKLNVEYLQPDPEGRILVKDLESLMKAHQVRMVAITHVSNVLGTIQDVASLAQVARQRGALSLVDAAQSAGRIPVDVGAIGCDFAAFCGRKGLMGPQGTGFLFAPEDRLADLPPLTTGSRAAELDIPKDYREFPPPHRFEAGILNTSGFIGLGESIRYLNQLGKEAVARRIGDLTQFLLGALNEIKGVVLYSPQGIESQAGIISWNIPGISPPEIVEWLDSEANVAVASGHQGSRLVTEPLSPEGIVRTSVHWFNTGEDNDALAEGLKRFVSSR
jgi:cysteine desulfurase/selenocysteine lyase